MVAAPGGILTAFRQISTAFWWFRAIATKRLEIRVKEHSNKHHSIG
jgi:hypothetical protein